MSQQERNKRYQERHKRLGLCAWCSRKAQKGRTFCSVCLEKMRERWMKGHPIICGECGKIVSLEERRERDGIRFHRACAEKRAKGYQERHRKQSRRYPQIHRSASLAYQERHRKLGLCTSCPRKVFKGGLCRKHYRMAQERYYERAAG